MSEIIDTKEKLKSVIEAERKNLFGEKDVDFEVRYRKSFKYVAFSYIKALREFEYYSERQRRAKGIAGHLYALKVKRLDRKKNILGLKAGLEFVPGRVSVGVTPCHPNVTLNGYIGEGCIFHGNNTVGNKKTGAGDEVPVLGKNVDVGTGAVIIGKVEIADNCVIGAGAVVTKSFTVPGTVIAGVPAREI